MARSLRATTIIPPHLYVERAADRQLDNIINEMGRPGYVLVARQMGKTNLLINMKRVREKLGDVVVYFDLSTRFESARALFRFIIDSILEADATIANVAGKIVADQRLSQETAPNLEYDRHLRLIMRAAQARRVIIVLDEIDSLISVPYSDTFFAQIRSMYFSRINHPEYQNLTYTLSGVAEPTDLIKDKNISPFNIGEKIYLDDFTLVEFKQLLSKASIGFSSTVVDEVYGWTAGNPRMTWDICAELEDIEINVGKPVKQSDVIAAVNKLYLTRFDRAPVDHIRVLAESDPQIRGAIISLRWGKGDTLDEKIRGRLYLAGISAGSSGAPTIKNKIIDAALSDSWLAQTTASQKSLLELAAEHFQEHRYEQTIQLIEDHVRQQPLGSELDLANTLRLGIAKYHEGQFEGSISSLGRVSEVSDSDEIIATCNFYIGSSMLKMGKLADAIPVLEYAVRFEGALQNSARLSLTSAYLGVDARGNLSKIEDVGRRVISEIAVDLGGAPHKTDDLDLLTSIYFNLGQAYRATGEKDRADQFLGFALMHAPHVMRPAILLMSSTGDSSSDHAGMRADLAANVIISERLALSPRIKASLGFNEFILARTMLLLLLGNRAESFDRLLSYASQTLYAHARSPFAVLVHLVQANFDEGALLIPLVWAAIERFQDETVSTEHRIEAARLVAQFSPTSQKSAAMDLYFGVLEQRLKDGGETKDDDVVILLNAAFDNVAARDFQRSLFAIRLGRKITDAGDKGYHLHKVLFLRQEMEIYRVLRNLDKAKTLASILVESIDEGFEDLNLEGGVDLKVTIDSYRRSAVRLLFNPEDDPYRKIRRNEKVSVKELATGRIWTTKFKLVEKELRENRCVLVVAEAKK